MCKDYDMRPSVHITISHVAAFQHHHCYRNLKLGASNGTDKRTQWSVVPTLHANATLAEATLDKGNDVLFF